MSQNERLVQTERPGCLDKISRLLYAFLPEDRELARIEATVVERGEITPQEPVPDSESSMVTTG